MTVEVRIPDYGEAKCSTKLSFWYKDEGEKVQQGEELAEFETDKAAFTIEAPVAGTLMAPRYCKSVSRSTRLFE